MAERRKLYVRLHGMVVAELTTPGPGKITCRYTPDALGSFELNTPILSCSLPLSRRPHKDAGRYFRGLLPEGAALDSAAGRAGVPTFDTFGLLARYGRDVAGACIISENGDRHGPGGVEPYGDGDLESEVGSLENQPLALHDDSELSLAGLQNKLLLVRTPDGWARPIGGYPSTHILKVEDRRFPGLVALEAQCLQLASQLRLTTVVPDVVRLAGMECLIVSRFDRRPDGTRIHQEDLCQACNTDINAARRRGKYQAFGGPGFRQAADLLSKHASHPDAQLERLLRAAVFTYLIGNADAHGKNLALLHREPGLVELAPLYDTVPTAVWPSLGERAAMTINDRAVLSAVGGDDLVAEAVGWGMPIDRARRAVARAVGDAASAVDLLSPSLDSRLLGVVEPRLSRLISYLEG